MIENGFKIVCRYDPALDAQAMSEGPQGMRLIDRYRETGDFSHVRIREGMTPTVFYCRRLKVSEMQSVRASMAPGSSQDDAFVAAFARGVRKVEGLRPLEPNEAEIEADLRRVWIRPDDTRPISARELDEVFAPGDVFEVGAAIYGRSVLGKGRPAAWPLPATSHLAVGGLVFRLAELTPLPAAPSGQSKSGPEGAPGEAGTG